MSKNTIVNARPSRILLIEHDQNLCETLSRLLYNSGFELRIYPCLKNIVPVVKEYQPDLVLLEYLSPVLNGGELCNQIKRNRLTRDIPVIIYSSFPKMLLSLGDYGYDGFIEKPFEFSYLLRKIDNFLRYQVNKKKNRMVPEYN